MALPPSTTAVLLGEPHQARPARRGARRRLRQRRDGSLGRQRALRQAGERAAARVKLPRVCSIPRPSVTFGTGRFFSLSRRTARFPRPPYLQASEADLLEWSGEIGSDISVFFSTGAAYCLGRGEIVKNQEPPLSLASRARCQLSLLRLCPCASGAFMPS